MKLKSWEWGLVTEIHCNSSWFVGRSVKWQFDFRDSITFSVGAETLITLLRCLPTVKCHQWQCDERNQKKRVIEKRQISTKNCFVFKVREGFPKKAAVLLDFVQITSPPFPQFGKLLKKILNAKNVNLSNIQNYFFLNKGRILALWVMYRLLRDPGILKNLIPGFFWDFLKPLNDCILRLSTPFIDHNSLFWDLWSLQEDQKSF